MNTYQTYPPHSSQNWWDQTKDTQNDHVLFQKFQLYDKNRDGMLEKSEFRSLLKDVFGSQISNQFLEDAIEETVWRIPNADFTTAKHAIASINDTLRGEPQPTSLSKPLNAQGEQLQYRPNTSNTTTTTSTYDYDFNPFNLPPPILPTLPPLNSTSLPPPLNTTSLPRPLNTASLPSSFNTTSLPPPLPMAPLRLSEDIPTLPPPPISNIAGVGGLTRATSATSMPRPAPPASTMSQPSARPLPAPAKVAAKPSAFVPTTQDMVGPAPVRVLPMGQAKPGLNSAASASEEESRAFVEYINTNVAMQQDPDVKGILPIKNNSSDIYTIVSDGWLLCKLLNAIQGEIIPSAQIKLHPRNAFEKIENHTLAIQAARKLGCKTVNIGPEDLLQGKPRLVLGLLWQIIKRDVLSKVSLAQHPEIYKLARNPNNLKEISDISPEEVLIKWANHHLQNATKGAVQIANFSKDVKDGTTYTLLMNQIAPQVCTTDALREPDVKRRAQMIVDNAKKLNCDRFVTASDIVNGNDKLNLAFVADLFNKHSGLELPTLEEMEKLKKQNANMSKILDEAEARLRQILADGQLAHELQQEEILLYRQRKLKEQEQLAEEEAMLRAQVQQEELMLAQQQRMKDMKLAEQESFAREEQKKEELRAKRPASSTTSTANTSYPRSTTTSSLAKPATKDYIPTYSSSSTPAPRTTSTNLTSAPAHPAHPTYTTPSTTSTTPSYPSGSSYYSASSSSAQNYATPSAQSTSTAYPSYNPAPATQSYTATPSYSATPQSYSSTPSYSATPQSYSTAPQSYSAAPQSYSTNSQPYSATPQSYSATPQSYTSTNYSSTPAPNPYNVTPTYSTANAYNTNVYPPTQNYPVDPSSSYTSMQTAYTEPPAVASYPEPADASPISVRRRGVFERVGKKIDHVFH